MHYNIIIVYTVCTPTAIMTCVAALCMELTFIITICTLCIHFERNLSSGHGMEECGSL